MLKNILDIIAGFGVTPIDLVCIVYLLKNLVYQPVKWFINKFVRGVTF